MGDFGTSAQQCLIDTREVSGNLVHVKLALIDACAHHQPIKFYFNELDFSITAPASTDKDTFGLSDGVPQGIMYVDGDLWADVDGDANNRHRVRRRGVDYLESLRAGQAYSNWPEYFAVKGDRLLLWPQSDDAHVLRFRGYKKIPAPRKAYDTAASAWKFPDGDSFTNEWFNEAERSVREYANYNLLGGPNSDAAAARSALARHLEALNDLILETGGRLAVPQPDPWPRVLA